MSAAVHLPLVRCEPYDGKLLEARCVERWRSAQLGGHPLQESSCKRCETGRQRAGGPDVVQRHRYAKVPGVAPRRSGTSGQWEYLVKCSCERTPEKWVSKRSIAKRYACQRCALERTRRAVGQRKFLARFTLSGLVDAEQAARSERHRRRAPKPKRAPRPKREYPAGYEFGRLSVVREEATCPRRGRMFVVRCECGTEATRPLKELNRLLGFGCRACSSAAASRARWGSK